MRLYAIRVTGNTNEYLARVGWVPGAYLNMHQPAQYEGPRSPVAQPCDLDQALVDLRNADTIWDYVQCRTAGVSVELVEFQLTEQAATPGPPPPIPRPRLQVGRKRRSGRG